MATNEDKFIVINKKHLEELTEKGKSSDLFVVNNLLDAVDEFRATYEVLCHKNLDQEYVVCNEDEPYAKDVLAVILSGEDAKTS